MGWDELRPLLAAAVTGDRAAQERVVAACYDDVRARVHRELQQDFRKHHRWILPLFSTHDVVHDVLAAVVRELKDCEFASAAAFHAFLGTLVHHRLIDAVRFHEAGRRDARRDVPEPAVGLGAVAEGARDPTPTLAASLAERAGLVRGALDELNERQRRLVELRLFEELPFAQIAEQLGYASDETARQAFWDAQARLLVKLRARGLGRTLGGA